jgi:hypothetical protein
LNAELEATLLSFKPSSMRATSASWRWSESSEQQRQERLGREEMRGILVDINVGKQWRAVLAIMMSDIWRDLWTGLGLDLESFPSLRLPYDSADTVIWRTCQSENLVLITGNRNDDAPDSLEAVIRDENQPNSLPVVTIANTERILHDRSYAELVAERFIDYLIRIDEVRGTGRIYIP